jgi:hypothetical protein
MSMWSKFFIDPNRIFQVLKEVSRHWSLLIKTFEMIQHAKMCSIGYLQQTTRTAKTHCNVKDKKVLDSGF